MVIHKPPSLRPGGDARQNGPPILPHQHLTKDKKDGFGPFHIAGKSKVKTAGLVLHRKMTPSSRMQGTGNNRRIGARRAPIRMLLPCLIAATSMFVSGQGNAFTCFSSADQVRQENPGAWPSWTLRAPGHEGTKCWYASTRAAAHDHQTPVTARVEHAGSKEDLERDGEVTGLATHADTVEAPGPVPGSPFDDRFSAMPSGTSTDFGSKLQQVIDLFRGVGGH
jgi:hypothetical protein